MCVRLSQFFFPWIERPKLHKQDSRTQWPNFAPGQVMNKNVVQKGHLLDGTRNPHVSTSHHRLAPLAESWDLPFVLSFRAPPGLSIKEEFARFRHTSWGWWRFCFCEVFDAFWLLLACCACCLLLLASWPDIYMEDGVIIYSILNYSRLGEKFRKILRQRNRIFQQEINK